MAQSDTEELRTMVREVLAEIYTPEALRSAVEGAQEPIEQLWDTAVKLSWTGIGVDERFDGAGGGIDDLAVLAAEFGRTLAPTSVLVHTGVVIPAVTAQAAPDHVGKLVGPLARGERRATAGWATRGGAWSPQRPSVRAKSIDGGVVLTGEVSWVPDLVDADDLLLLAGLEGSDEVLLLLVDVTSRDVRSIAQLDLTRRYGSCTFDGSEVPAERVLGVLDDVAVQQLVANAATWVAIDSAAAAEAVTADAVTHAKSRHQFGRAIGSFQAVKHTLAEMYCHAREARALAEVAIDVAGTAEASRLASLAKAQCADSYATVAGDAVQMFGGIGFTWEHHAHLHVRRARANQALYGSSSWHRERAAQTLLGNTDP
ncbi:acyl-CoA dehydrogenase family protein [[Mycobacterium] vasticus]|nr:acyl-CoA dehydrogenase family protein [Mycolicibacter sp. MYC017]